jgi:aurora kinase
VVLAQRYAEGGDLLRALHKAGGRLTEKSAVQMVIQPLLNCLVYLHGKGITHRWDFAKPYVVKWQRHKLKSSLLCSKRLCAGVLWGGSIACTG